MIYRKMRSNAVLRLWQEKSMRNTEPGTAVYNLRKERI